MTKRKLYCEFCKLCPRTIIVRYTQPIEDVLTYNDNTGLYEFEASNHPCGTEWVDGVPQITPEKVELCGICNRKLVEFFLTEARQQVNDLLF